MGKVGKEGRSDVISMQPCGLRLWKVSASFAEQVNPSACLLVLLNTHYTR